MAVRAVEFLLVGGGLAAGNCARHLREQGAEGEVLLVGREPDPPYNRPDLSKGYVRGEKPREEVLFRPDDWYVEQKVELLTRTTVTGLDASARRAKLSGGDEVTFSKALLATGSNVNRLQVEGEDVDGIHYLRTFANSDALREEAAQGERVVLIGGSYIATELAASFTALGKQVELLMLEDVTLERGFGPEVGGFFQGVLTEHGVKIHAGDQIERFEGSGGRISKVISKGGLELECDFCVIGAGVHPDLTVAKGAGLELGASGVAASKTLETSVPGIFCAGDIAEYDSVVHGRRMRIEHWDVAFNQGKTAALNMLGQNQPHDVVPYFFSDLADWASMEYVGPALEWDEVVIRGSLDDGEFSAWYLKDGRVAAGMSVGRSEDLSQVQRLLGSGADVSGSREALADLDSDLEQIG